MGSMRVDLRCAGWRSKFCGWILLAVALLLVWPILGSGSEPASGDITGEQLVKLLAKEEPLWMLDVREQFEYDAGHIPNSVLIPLGQIGNVVHWTELEKDDLIIVVCRSGNRSGAAQIFLQELGFSNVYNLVGGMLRWPGPVRQTPSC